MCSTVKLVRSCVCHSLDVARERRMWIYYTNSTHEGLQYTLVGYGLAHAIIGGAAVRGRVPIDDSLYRGIV